MTQLLYSDLAWQAVPAGEDQHPGWLFTDGNLTVRLEGRAPGTQWQGTVEFYDRHGDKFNAQAEASAGYEALRQCAVSLAGRVGGPAGPRLLQALDLCPRPGSEAAAPAAAPAAALATPAQAVQVELLPEDESTYRDYEVFNQSLMLRLVESDVWRGNYRWVGCVTDYDPQPADKPPESETVIYGLSAADAMLKFLPVCARDTLQAAGVTLCDMGVKWFDVSREIEPFEVPDDITDWRPRSESDAGGGRY